MTTVKTIPGKLADQLQWQPSLACLNAHMRKKSFQVRMWLGRFMGQLDDGAFPFKALASGIGQISKQAFIDASLQAPARMDPRAIRLEACVHYMVMIPVYFPFDGSGPKRLKNLLACLQEQAFTDKKSARERLHIAVLVNRPCTFNEQETADFEADLAKIQVPGTLDVHVMALQWRALWQSLFPMPAVCRSTPEQVPQLLRIMAPGDDRFDRCARRSLAQVVPYRTLRQSLLKSDYVRAPIAWQLPKGQLMGVSLDSDTLALNDNETHTGYFTLLDRYIRQLRPDMISLGYGLLRDYPLAFLSARIDMAIRAAMSQNGFIPYLPEPSVAFELNEKQSYGKGPGQTVEGRRFVQEGLETGAMEKQHIHFVHERALVTTTAERMLVKTTRKMRVLNRAAMTTKAFYQALRGFAQTHFDPRQWAENIYLSLGLKVKTLTDATAPLMEVFKSFDPIERLYGQLLLDRSLTSLIGALQSHRQLNARLLDAAPADAPTLPAEQAAILDLQTQRLQKASQALAKIGVKAAMLARLRQVAHDCALAASRILLEALASPQA